MKKNILPYTEGELITMLLKQDRHAFNYLYENYSAALYGVVLKIIIKEEISQDLLQEIFIKIWRNLERYDANKGRLFTWMIHIARNTSYDYLRTQRHEMQEISTAVCWIENNQNVFGDTENYTLKELTPQLKKEHKILIEMIYWEGYTHEETAECLKLPLGTVKTRVRAALKRLRFIVAGNFNAAAVHN